MSPNLFLVLSMESLLLNEICKGIKNLVKKPVASKTVTLTLYSKHYPICIFYSHNSVLASTSSQ